MANKTTKSYRGVNKSGSGPKPVAATLKDYADVFRRVVTIADFEEVVQKQLERAQQGDRESIKYLIDRVLGKPVESVDMTSGGDKVALTVYIPQRRDKTT